MIDRYLTLGYVPSPQTAFAGISKLPPAHYLVVDARPGGGLSEPELVRYWRLPEPHSARRHRTAIELRHELIERLEEAVRLRLVSDVPLGAFLSGGIDSSAVVAMMARAVPRRHEAGVRRRQRTGIWVCQRFNFSTSMQRPCQPLRKRQNRLILHAPPAGRAVF